VVCSFSSFKLSDETQHGEMTLSSEPWVVTGVSRVSYHDGVKSILEQKGQDEGSVKII
jgi:hypothetical protein